MTPQNSSSCPRFHWLAPTLLTSIGAVLRFTGLGRSELWFDEIMTVRDAAQPWSHVHALVLASPPLFHYVVKVVASFWGTSEFILRFPAAFFGTITIPLIYALARRLLGDRSALWAAAFLTFSPFHILYSQELRMYSLTTLLLLGSQGALLKTLNAPSKTSWGLYIAWVIAALYSHNWALFFIVGQALYCGVEVSQKRISWIGPLISYLLLAIGYSPWMPWLLRQAHRPVYNHLAPPGAAALLDTAKALVGVQVSVGDVTVSIATPAVWLVLILVGTILLTFLSTKTDQDTSFPRVFFVCNLITPLALAFLISRYAIPLYLPSRYPLFVLPLLFVGMAAVLGSTRRSIALASQVAGALILLAWCSLWPRVHGIRKADWKAMASVATHEAGAGDAIWMEPLGYERMALEYYLPPSLRRTSDPLDPSIAHLWIPTPERINTQKPIPLGPRLDKRWQVRAVYPFMRTSVIALGRKERTRATSSRAD